jgi:carboxylate-amine ligase
MPLPDFKSSEPFTLGIELELQVVNPPGYDLSQDSSALIAAVKDDIKGGEVKHDITESMLEIATGVCQTIDQAAAQFSVMQQSILRAAAEQHIRSAAAGRIRSRNGSVRRCATTSAITSRWSALAT